MSTGNVAVTNKGTEEFVGKFDGRTIVFAPGATVVISELAAMFLFGFGLPPPERGRVFQRNGWMTNSDPASPYGPKAALARLGTFTFQDGPPDTPREKPKALVLETPKRAAKDAKVTVTMASSINVPGRSAPLAPPSSSPA